MFAAQDLYSRTQEQEGVKKAKLCMHTGTFVFHFKVLFSLFKLFCFVTLVASVLP